MKRLFKKYQWENQDLKKHYKKLDIFGWFTLLLGFVILLAIKVFYHHNSLSAQINAIDIIILILLFIGWGLIAYSLIESLYAAGVKKADKILKSKINQEVNNG